MLSLSLLPARDLSIYGTLLLIRTLEQLWSQAGENEGGPGTGSCGCFSSTRETCWKKQNKTKRRVLQGNESAVSALLFVSPSFLPQQQQLMTTFMTKKERAAAADNVADSTATEMGGKVGQSHEEKISPSLWCWFPAFLPCSPNSLSTTQWSTVCPPIPHCTSFCIYPLYPLYLSGGGETKWATDRKPHRNPKFFWDLSFFALEHQISLYIFLAPLVCVLFFNFHLVNTLLIYFLCCPLEPQLGLFHACWVDVFSCALRGNTKGGWFPTPLWVAPSSLPMTYGIEWNEREWNETFIPIKSTLWLRGSPKLFEHPGPMPPSPTLCKACFKSDQFLSLLIYWYGHVWE